MNDIIFRLAKKEEKAKIFAFMDEYWGSKHPILHDDRFFHYYFETHTGINFALAVQEETILAACGFIPCNQAVSSIWISLWQAAPKQNGVGLELMSKMGELTGAKSISCNNIRPRTMPLYDFLGYSTGMLNHYYRLSEAYREYHIAKIVHRDILPVSCKNVYQKVEDFTELEVGWMSCTHHNPPKDLWYLHRRYYEFPQYRYTLYALKNKEKIESILVVRVNNSADGTVLRIVDYLGSEENFAQAGATINRLLRETNAEYVDCYCVGLSKDTMEQAGFSLREINDENIIPNYLNPLLRENVDYYYFAQDAKDFRMFRADGDQDRPNLSVQ